MPNPHKAPRPHKAKHPATVTIVKSRPAGQSYGRGPDSQRHPARYDILRNGEVVGYIQGSSTRQYEKSNWEVFMPYKQLGDPHGTTMEEKTDQARRSGRAPLYTFYSSATQEETPFNRAKAFATSHFGAGN